MLQPEATVTRPSVDTSGNPENTPLDTPAGTQAHAPADAQADNQANSQAIASSLAASVASRDDTPAAASSVSWADLPPSNPSNYASTSAQDISSAEAQPQGLSTGQASLSANARDIISAETELRPDDEGNELAGVSSHAQAIMSSRGNEPVREQASSSVNNPRDRAHQDASRDEKSDPDPSGNARSGRRNWFRRATRDAPSDGAANANPPGTVRRRRPNWFHRALGRRENRNPPANVPVNASANPPAHAEEEDEEQGAEEEEDPTSQTQRPKKPKNKFVRGVKKVWDFMGTDSDAPPPYGALGGAQRKRRDRYPDPDGGGHDFVEIRAVASVPETRYLPLSFCRQYNYFNAELNELPEKGSGKRPAIVKWSICLPKEDLGVFNVFVKLIYTKRPGKDPWKEKGTGSANSAAATTLVRLIPLAVRAYLFGNRLGTRAATGPARVVPLPIRAYIFGHNLGPQGKRFRHMAMSQIYRRYGSYPPSDVLHPDDARFILQNLPWADNMIGLLLALMSVRSFRHGTSRAADVKEDWNKILDDYPRVKQELDAITRFSSGKPDDAYLKMFAKLLQLTDEVTGRRLNDRESANEGPSSAGPSNSPSSNAAQPNLTSSNGGPSNAGVSNGGVSNARPSGAVASNLAASLRAALDPTANPAPSNAAPSSGGPSSREASSGVPSGGGPSNGGPFSGGPPSGGPSNEGASTTGPSTAGPSAKQNNKK